MNPIGRTPLRHLLLAVSPLLCGASATLSDVQWVTGVQHPFANLDHLLALLMLGFVAAQFGPRSAWGMPAMFLALLGAGMVLGQQGITAPTLETILMTAGLALALLILGQVHLPFAIVTTTAGAFALFHGVGDGTLLRESGAGLPFVAGFVPANLAVLTFAVLLGLWARPWVLRTPHHWPGRTAHLHG